MDLPTGFHDNCRVTGENSRSHTDPIKSKVLTSPFKPGGTNFKTNVLIQANPSKLIYKPSIGAAIFCFIFFAVGLGILFFNLIPLFTGDPISINWFLIIFGLLFSGAGAFMFYTFYKPRVFDKQLGFYYTAYTFKPYKSKQVQTKNYLPLSKIVAIQIIGENVKSDDGSYKSFELNLVLNDASRRNVVDHGNLKSIIDDAHVLSQFLNVPIWHAKSNTN